MQTFFSEFPINSSIDMETLILQGIEWIAGSPHSEISEEELSEALTHTEWHQEYDSEHVALKRAKTSDYELAGIKYDRFEESGVTWSTTVIGEKRVNDFWVGIRISCETSNLAKKLPKPKKPYIIKQLVEKYSGGKDGNLVISSDPIILKNSEIDFAASLLRGEAGNKLPIIYLSAPFSGKRKINDSNLAKWLSGMAHVVTEPNRAFSIRLLDEVKHTKIVHSGAIGIYWPDGSGLKKFYTDRDQKPENLTRIITDDIRTALALRQPTTRCTWFHLTELHAKNTILSLQSSGSNEVEKYIEAFGEELKSKQEHLENAEREINRLKALLQQYKGVDAAGEESGDGLFQSREERDLYPGESNDLLLEVLKTAKTYINEDSRRLHLVDDILNTTKPTGNMRSIEASLKSTMRTYRDMDSKTKASLEELGFSISGDGKHYKLIFRNDPRYTFVIPKTSSDFRSGKNSASDISKKLF